MENETTNNNLTPEQVKTVEQHMQRLREVISELLGGKTNDDSVSAQGAALVGIALHLAAQSYNDNLSVAVLEAMENEKG